MQKKVCQNCSKRVAKKCVVHNAFVARKNKACEDFVVKK